MAKLKIASIAGLGWWWLTVASPAQNAVVYALPPPPATALEILETNVGKVVIKGTAPVGSLSVNGLAIAVTCKEDIDTVTGRKLYGLAIDVGSGASGRPEDRTVVDYEELASMLDSCDYLARVDWSVTTLSSFSAGYISKGGFRIAAFSSRRADVIEFSLRSSRMERPALLNGTQLAQFRGLIDQAKRKLDEIRSGHATAQPRGAFLDLTPRAG